MICIISCSKYNKGTASGPGNHHPTSIRTKYDSLKVYPDSSIYIYSSPFIARADTQSIYPQHFRIKLPPDLRHASIADMDEFGFLFKKKQVIYIYLNRDAANTGDTTFTITNEEEIDILLHDKLAAINHKKPLNIGRNPYSTNRTTMIIKKGNATILLYNVTKKEQTRFFTYAGSFTFL